MTGIHLYELPLHPTPEQLHHLRQLRVACGLVALATAEQAYWQARGQDVSIAALLGGADHPNRTAEGEARALRKESDVSTVPFTLLENAILSQRIEQSGTSVRGAGGATVRLPVPLGGAAWVTHAVPQGLQLAGVPGIVAARTDDLYRAYAEDREETGTRIVLTGAAWADHGHGDHGWIMDVELNLVEI